MAGLKACATFGRRRRHGRPEGLRYVRPRPILQRAHVNPAPPAFSARCTLPNMLLSRRPRPPLDTFIECVWHHAIQHSGAHAPERVLPNGRFQLVLNLGSGTASVSGLRSKFVVVDTAAVSCAMGVVFAAAAPTYFFAPSAREFSERSVALSLVWGPYGIRLLERLQGERSPLQRLTILESALLDILVTRTVRHHAIHPAVIQALRMFHRAPHINTVTDVSSASGWSRRWLTRVFNNSVGMTPKRYCRL